MADSTFDAQFAAAPVIEEYRGYQIKFVPVYDGDQYPYRSRDAQGHGGYGATLEAARLDVDRQIAYSEQQHAEWDARYGDLTYHSFVEVPVSNLVRAIRHPELGATAPWHGGWQWQRVQVLWRSTDQQHAIITDADGAPGLNLVQVVSDSTVTAAGFAVTGTRDPQVLLDRARGWAEFEATAARVDAKED